MRAQAIPSEKHHEQTTYKERTRGSLYTSSQNAGKMQQVQRKTSDFYPIPVKNKRLETKRNTCPLSGKIWVIRWLEWIRVLVVERTVVGAIARAVERAKSGMVLSILRSVIEDLTSATVQKRGL